METAIKNEQHEPDLGITALKTAVSNPDNGGSSVPAQSIPPGQLPPTELTGRKLESTSPIQAQQDHPITARQAAETGAPMEKRPDVPGQNSAQSTVTPNLQTEGVLNIAGNNFTIDPRYRNMDPVTAVHHTMQSQMDSIRNEKAMLAESNKKLNTDAETLDLLLTDDTALRAFVNERLPGAIKEDDIDAKIEAQLAQEFGENFEYDPEEAQRNIKSDSARYLRRFKYYETKALADAANNTTAKSFKELIAERKKAQIEQEEQLKADITRFKAKHKLDDNQFNSYKRWAQRIVQNPDTFYELYAIAMQTAGQQVNIPSVSSMNGTGAGGNTIQARLSNLLGSNPNVRR